MSKQFKIHPDDPPAEVRLAHNYKNKKRITKHIS